MLNCLEGKIGLERIQLLVKCGNFQTQSVEPGDLIIKEGEPVIYAYWTDMLEFSANKVHPSGEILYLGQYSLVNQFLGDESILSRQPSCFNVIAKSCAKLILVPIDTLLDVLNEDTKISIWYTKTLSLKCKSIMDVVLSCSRKSLSHCIAADIVNRDLKGLSRVNIDRLQVEAHCMGCSSELYMDSIQTLIDADLLKLDPVTNVVSPKSIVSLNTFLNR